MRITRVYTGAGDLGMTRLGDGSKVSKDHPRVVAYGRADRCATRAVTNARADVGGLGAVCGIRDNTCGQPSLIGRAACFLGIASTAGRDP